VDNFPWDVDDLRTAPVGLGSSFGWESRKTLSPSQLSKGFSCMRSWALPYLLGLRSPWVQGAPVGLATHWLLEQYIKTGSVKAFTLPLPKGRRYAGLGDGDEQLARDAARAIMPHIPVPSDSLSPEHKLTLDTTRWMRDTKIEWEPNCSMDLAAPEETVPTVFDYKTTGGNPKRKDRWCYVPTPDELVQDAQFNIYCASLWQQLNDINGYDGPIRGSWIYVSKLRPVVARTISAMWTPSNVWFMGWLGLARDMVAMKNQEANDVDFRKIKLPVVPEDAGYRDIPCNSYGGCVYHSRKGGPCGGVREATT